MSVKEVLKNPKPEDNSNSRPAGDADLTDPSVPIDYEAPNNGEDPIREEVRSRSNQAIETD